MNKELFEENDRNIRVFGLETQKKLFESEILILNMTSMISELCKNLILSGAGLCLLDDNSKIDKNNTENIFFFNSNDIDKKKVYVLREKIKTFKENCKINIIKEIKEIINRKIKYAVFDMSEDSFNKEIIKQIEDMMIPNKGILYYIKINNDKGIFFNNILEKKFLSENKNDNNEARFVKDEKIIDHMDLSDDESNNNENKTDENNKKEDNINKNDEKQKMKVVEINNNEEEDSEKEILKEDDYEYLDMEEKIKKIKDLIPKNMKKNEELIVKNAFGVVDNEINVLSQKNPLNCLTNYVLGGIVCHEIINCISRKKNPRTNIYYYDAFNGTGKFLNELYDKVLDN